MSEGEWDRRLRAVESDIREIRDMAVATDKAHGEHVAEDRVLFAKLDQGQTQILKTQESTAERVGKLDNKMAKAAGAVVIILIVAQYVLGKIGH